MSRVRTLTGAKRPRGPVDPQGWNQLMLQVIARCEKLGAPDLPGLRAALSQGKAEQLLRRLGIISQADIDREFPHR
jgi:hypothetical protein